MLLILTMTTDMERTNIMKVCTRIQSFDLLKVVALLYIIFGWHMDDYAGDLLATQAGRTLVIGALGIFMFVSGFTLTMSCGEVLSAKDIMVYLKKRFLRIYPLYCLALLLSLAIAESTPKEFATAIFLLNAILDIKIKTYWFVTMIFIFYLMLPLLLYRFSQTRAIIISLAFLAFCLVMNRSLGLMDIRLAYYFPVFAWGVFCSKNAGLFHLTKNNIFAVFSMVMLGVATSLVDPKQGEAYRHLYIMMSLIFSISPLLIVGERLRFLATARFFTQLAYAAFGMYLFHRIVFLALLALYRPPSQAGTVLYLFVAGLPLIFLVSSLIQKGYDTLLEKINLRQVSRHA